MYIPFETLPSNARLWIYQSSRYLTNEEENYLLTELKLFCEQWNAHGQPLKTSFKIQHHFFVILAVDQNFNDTSGCSIDGSVRILKSFQEKFEISLLDRSRVAFQLNTEIQSFSLQELKNLFSSGRLTATTLTFNNLVATKSDFEKDWLIPVDKSWLAKYLPKAAVA